MFPTLENMNGSTLENQSLAAVCRVTDAFIAFLEGAATPLRAGDLPATGPEAALAGDSGSGLPNKSHCIADLPNGGCVIVNPPDPDDDRMEARR